MNQTRLFHALNGFELRQILLTEFENRLNGCQILQSHLTFPKVSYKLELTIDSYPMSEPATVGATRTLGDPQHSGPSNREELVYSRELGETQETAPDKIREENEIPVLRTERQEDTGLLIDKEAPRRISATVGEGTKPRKTVKSVPRVETYPDGDVIEVEAVPE